MEKIDFSARVVAPEEALRIERERITRLEEIGDDEGLGKVASLRMDEEFHSGCFIPRSLAARPVPMKESLGLFTRRFPKF